MKFYPHPGYEALWNLPDSMTETQKILKSFNNSILAEDMESFDTQVPGLNGAPDVPIRVIRHRESKNAPLVIDIHGGGFVSGDLDLDDPRNIPCAEKVPCTVISVAYRLSPQSVFPAALEDCYAVLAYAHGHPEEFGIDPQKIAVFGTSAGGAIAAGLCLYARDKHGPKVSALVLNFPTIDCLNTTTSMSQFAGRVPMFKESDGPSVWDLYLGGFTGDSPSYYAVPSLARDIAGMPPTCVVACEYDPLRDEAIDFARRLMKAEVPTELYVLPRMTHGFDLVPANLTVWIREGIYNSLRREFKMI